VGQDDAKRAVAIALRNRWRRMHVSDELQQEVMPKSILMIGPTGCGKTEIARRLAGICDAPFVKVEATKFTEVGFHGRDVDMIIRDLVEASLLLTKKQKRARMMPDVVARVEDRILDSLTGKQSRTETRETFLRFLRNGSLEQREIEIEIPAAAGNPAGGPGAVVGFDPAQQGSIPLNEIIGKIGKAMHGGRTERKTMTVAEARKALEEVELEKLTDDTEMAAEAIANVEQNGIVVIDEIDKICSPEGDRYSGDASAEGVQRDLLPLVEGSIVSTKHGNVNTDFILFICAGAFHHCKPSDLLPELQGRLPIRVELKGLTQADMKRILVEPEANLLKQQVALLGTENVELVYTDECVSCVCLRRAERLSVAACSRTPPPFPPPPASSSPALALAHCCSAIDKIAEVAYEVNTKIENIGARRLHTVIERIMEEYSFEAAEMEDGSTITIDEAVVVGRIGDLLEQQDLSKFIL
jgi:ATP-dependent HslUV protease ATP-binding subunit HslU